ncbi:MAG: hypothetical protein U1E33_06145 [Rhodospirillales bacterium]
MRLGEGGDGIAETADGRLYVPLTVPGDRVRALPLRPRSGWLRRPPAGGDRRRPRPDAAPARITASAAAAPCNT